MRFDKSWKLKWFYFKLLMEKSEMITKPSANTSHDLISAFHPNASTVQCWFRGKNELAVLYHASCEASKPHKNKTSEKESHHTYCLFSLGLDALPTVDV